MLNKTHISFVRNFNLSSSLYELIFAYPIYTLFFSKQGMSALQISFLLTFWALTAMILEIPSGALADYWSRKKLLVLAPLIKSICYVLWFFADGNFYIFMFGFLFWSIGSSFVSGTQEALLYDYLYLNGYKHHFTSNKENFIRLAKGINIPKLLVLLSSAFLG